MWETATNPPIWAEKVLRKHWGLLKRAYKGILPRSPRADEHGCGFFGCVWPTNKKGVVFKITKDRNEAKLVTFLIKNKNKWPGIVKYFKIVRLDVGQETLDAYVISRQVQDGDCNCVNCVGYLLDRGPVWAIWREEVKPGYPALRYLKSGMPLLLNSSKSVFWMNRERRITPKVLKKAKSLAQSGRRLQGSRPEVVLASISRAANAVKKKSKDLCHVADAVLQLYKKNIIISDLHLNNIGKTPRGWVISDPGDVAWLGKTDGLRRAPPPSRHKGGSR